MLGKNRVNIRALEHDATASQVWLPAIEKPHNDHSERNTGILARLQGQSEAVRGAVVKSADIVEQFSILPSNTSASFAIEALSFSRINSTTSIASR
jgi:hypothetical protein